jgi:CRP-like cAMP-binding protein
LKEIKANIYILKSGRVFLTYTKVDTGEEVKEEVRQGEFFGVKSALGRYPREETAQNVGETIVVILTLADFERMILRNVNIVRKMLRVFSNQLRRIGKAVRTVLGESENVNPILSCLK